MSGVIDRLPGQQCMCLGEHACWDVVAGTRMAGRLTYKL